jgi:hypothetical protein
MVNVRGTVSNNPALITTAPATATGPCTANLPGQAPQTFANCTTSLDQRREFSLLNPANGQFFGYLDTVSDEGWQNYHGLLINAQQRAVHGISGGGNYTLSTCEGLINQGGGPLNVATGYLQPISVVNPPSDADRKKMLESDKGRCSSWRRHILNLNASYETPQFGGPAVRMLASGWRISGIYRYQSGAPLTVTTGTDRALSGMQASIQRANQVKDNPYGAKTLTNWFDPTAFAQPALGTYGNSVRNAFDGPGRQTVDLSLIRSFRFATGQRIEARVEAFNAFNRFVWDNPNTTLSSASFGRITSTGSDPRVMQFALRYEF